MFNLKKRTRKKIKENGKLLSKEKSKEVFLTLSNDTGFGDSSERKLNGTKVHEKSYKNLFQLKRRNNRNVIVDEDSEEQEEKKDQSKQDQSKLMSLVENQKQEVEKGSRNDLTLENKTASLSARRTRRRFQQPSVYSSAKSMTISDSSLLSCLYSSPQSSSTCYSSSSELPSSPSETC